MPLAQKLAPDSEVGSSPKVRAKSDPAKVDKWIVKEPERVPGRGGVRLWNGAKFGPEP